MLSVRTATQADAGRLTAFARDAFQDAFAAQNTPEDMQAYLTEVFSEARQAAEIRDAGTITLLAETDAALVGYAQLRSGPAPACVAGPKPIELVRFYVDREWHGRGIAQTLMRAVEEAAGARARTMWLGVWEHNPRAIAFYTKCGFVDVGSHRFRLGKDLQTDRIMMRSLHSQ